MPRLKTEAEKRSGVQRHRQGKKPPLPVEECKHLRLKLGDSGFSFYADKRDTDLVCMDCGTRWSIVLNAYSKRASIHIFPPSKSS